MNRYDEKMNNLSNRSNWHRDVDYDCCRNNCYDKIQCEKGAKGEKGSKGDKGDAGPKGEPGSSPEPAYIALSTNFEDETLLSSPYIIPFSTSTPSFNISAISSQFPFPIPGSGPIYFSLPGVYQLVVTIHVANATEIVSDMYISLGTPVQTAITPHPKTLSPTYRAVPGGEFRLFSSTHIITVSDIVDNDNLHFMSNIPIFFGGTPSLTATITKIS